MTDAKKKILFLCTGNAARSQMSEALARIDYPDLLDPVSAGSRPAGFVHPLAIRAIEELGFPIGRARSKSAQKFLNEPLDIVVTVCDSAAADCPTWPAARHLVNWSIKDPPFVVGTDEQRRQAFRATRDELRRRIDALVEALRRPQAHPSDVDLLESGARILADSLKPYSFKFGGVREETAGQRRIAIGEFRRRDRTLELQVRSGVLVATYKAGERKLLHPKYLERLGAAGEMRFPGLSKDPLNAFRRLRTDLVRFAGPFFKGKALPEFERPTRPIRKAT
jgi:arsenate reductase (thioredoxin)